MAVTFYRIPRHRHRDVDGQIKLGDEITTLSNGLFRRIRIYLMSSYDADIGVALLKIDDDRTEEEKKMLRDISPWVPEPLWGLLCQSDNDGELSSEEVKSMMEELRKNKYFVCEEGKAPYVPVDNHLQIPHREWKYRWSEEVSNNDWLNEPLEIQEVNKFIGNLYQSCVDERYGVLWC